MNRRIARLTPAPADPDWSGYKPDAEEQAWMNAPMGAPADPTEQESRP